MATVRDGGMIGIWLNHLGPSDPAMLFSDGWIAVARSNPYRVDWREPDGQWLEGDPIPNRPIEATDRELLASLDRYFRHGTGMSDWDPEQMLDRHARYIDYPSVIPAVAPVSQSGSEMSSYFTRTLAAAPDGRLLVRRSQPADSTWVRYDIVDRHGRANGFLRLAEREEIAGTGEHSLYLVETDDTGCQRLARAAWVD